MSFFIGAGVLSVLMMSSGFAAMTSMSLKKQDGGESLKKQDGGESSKKQDGGEVIVIGGTESYISMPGTDKVPTSVSEYTVIAYDPDSTSLNSASSWEENEECPGGGHDCLYIERVENGRVTAITDKDGNDFLQKFVDDLYAGKLSKIDDMDIEDLKKTKKLSEDNKLMAKLGDNWVKIEPGKTYEYAGKTPGANHTFGPISISQYLPLLMVLYKAEGKPKPSIEIDMPAVKRKVYTTKTESPS